jgi:hypothetical protein
MDFGWEQSFEVFAVVAGWLLRVVADVDVAGVERRLLLLAVELEHPEPSDMAHILNEKTFKLTWKKLRKILFNFYLKAWNEGG